MLTCIKIAVLGLDDSSCIQKDTMLVGQSIGVEDSSSWEDCQEQCMENSACKEWTFCEKDMKCNLFHEFDDIVDKMGKISGPKDCSDFDNSTIPSDTNRVDPATATIIAAAVQAGATLLTSTAGESAILQMKGGETVKIGPGNCWRDGGGACPNGNCLDSNGRQGVIIREEVFTCRWFCVNRPKCRYQTCCDRVVYHGSNSNNGGGKCFASSGYTASQKCAFPFKYKGINYHGCTKANHGKFWCSTKTNGAGEYIPKEWGNCDTNACKDQLCITTGYYKGTKQCVFPFKFRGKTYYTCTMDHHNAYWCSTKNNSAGEKLEWANCNKEQCKGMSRSFNFNEKDQDMMQNEDFKDDEE